MKYIIVTGGAGFIGSNLIEKLLILNKKNKIISLDDYSSGSKKNHISSKRVKYIKGNTKNFNKIFKNYKNKIDTIFHFGEFSRIAQSFIKTEECLESNVKGSYEVIKFCLNYNIKIIYSATSATLGDNLNPHRSPYSFSKFNNLNLLINLHRWFGLKYSVIYFYNVYGGRHIKNHFMSAVVGIFETQYKSNKPLTVVKPGTQKRNFTHIDDTINCVLKVYSSKKNELHYAVYNNKFLSILKLAKLFSEKIKFIKQRPGERFESKFVKSYRGIKIHKYLSTSNIEKYIKNFKKGM